MWPKGYTHAKYLPSYQNVLLAYSTYVLSLQHALYKDPTYASHITQLCTNVHNYNSLNLRFYNGKLSLQHDISALTKL